MAVKFEGFAKVVDRSALRPGRWVVAQVSRSAALCFVTAMGEGAERVMLTFRPTGVEEVRFAPMILAEIGGVLTSVEDEMVFAPGGGIQPLGLFAPTRRPFPSGALLRLSSGDLGIGYAGPRLDELNLVSLTTGEPAQGFDLVFERWSLSVRRGEAETFLGRFRHGETQSDLRHMR
jgi:hypothetical protein